MLEAFYPLVGLILTIGLVDFAVGFIGGVLR